MTRQTHSVDREIDPMRILASVVLSGFAIAALADDHVTRIPPASRTSIATDTLREKLVALEKQSWEAWKNHDGGFFQKFLSDDHVEVGFNGVTDKAAVVAGVGSPICSVKQYSLDRFQLVVMDANAAVLTYHAAQETTCNGVVVPSPVWASSLYLKRGGHWFNALYQQTHTTK
jgi:Domain of unknown function (DUF4440)